MLDGLHPIPSREINLWVTIKKLTVIVPCYQEKENIQSFRTELFPEFTRYPFEKEFIFVNDGSTDGTSSELAKLTDKQTDCRVVVHPQNQGLGASVQTGIKNATGDAILVLDADLTFNPREFRKLFEAFDDDIDCVLGSPLKGTLEGVHVFRKFLSHVVNVGYGLLLGNSFTSASSIFRLYRSDGIVNLKLKSQDFQINAEILFHLIKNKKNIREVGVTLTRRKWGKSKINIIREIRNHIFMFSKILKWRLVG